MPYKMKDPFKFAASSCACNPVIRSILSAPKEYRGYAMNRRGLLGAGLGIAALLAQGAVPAVARAVGAADQIYFNGQILTMRDAQPTAQALAVRGGRIIAVGSAAEVGQWRGPNTAVTDLQGRTMTPGILDPHSHVLLCASYLSYQNLSPPPLGPGNSIANIMAAMKSFQAAGRGLPDDRGNVWLIGHSLDNTQLPGYGLPTKDDIDPYFPDVPVVLMHMSTHILICNSKALAIAGITAQTPDPQGGVIVREPGSMEPNGILEELSAMLLMLPYAPALTMAQTLANLRQLQNQYASWGITTTQDGNSLPSDVATLLAASQAGALSIDVVTYPNYNVINLLAQQGMGPGYRSGRLRVGGVKLQLDGAPTGETAWLTQPYFNTLDNPPGWAGFGQMTDETVQSFLAQGVVNNWQIIAHCNGDAATDQLLRNVAAINRIYGTVDRRTICIHAQISREDQIASMAALKIRASFFPSHVPDFGDFYSQVALGPARSANISPTGWALKYGVPFTIHTDAPVVPNNYAAAMWSAVNRTTRSGALLGPDQRITRAQALRSVTVDAAAQYIEENDKGALGVGMRADMVIWQHDPLTIPVGTMWQNTAWRTIKDGATIYAAS